MGLANKVGVYFVIKEVKGAEINKALGFNKRGFVTTYFSFTNNSFSLFCFYYFFSAFSVN